jgi:imidazolonepropionase-like amidohydrolase
MAIALVVLLAVAQGTTEPAIVFTNVNLITMNDEGVRRAYTVLVQGDRIVAIGRNDEVVIPPDARRIDGGGRYLLPGLVDAHVHLEDLPWAHSPENFGDGPRYLANGVTTVINLGGSARELDWRRRVARGDLAGPTIYTSGAFINEPRIASEDAMAREIRAQVGDGFDLIKFHELQNTTKGLSREVYRTMIATARAEKVPLVGHLPNNLGVDEWLQARQPAAHVGILSNIYFRPVRTFLFAVATSVASALVIAVMAIVSRKRRVALAAVLAALLVVSVGTVIPYGLFFDSVVMRAVVVALAVAFFVVVWRLRGVVTLTAGVIFAAALGGYWMPMLWRSSEAGMERFAKRVRDAEISVQSTLVVYETLDAGPMARVGDFNQALLGALHRAGVEIVAGTDAHGIPGVEPGTSMYRELELLVKSGLTPYDALRAATVAPARFLGKEPEFGTIAVGKRADLLLLEANPLERVDALRSPVGVMVRGRWLPRG